MATTFQTGDAVTIISRDATAADAKSNLYYPHFGGLTGSILKMYGEEASVLIDRTSLPQAIRERHENNEDGERKKYIDRLSQTAASSLSDKEKNFSLNYVVLIGIKDLTPSTSEAAAAETAKRLSQKDLDAAEAAFLAERAKKK